MAEKQAKGQYVGVQRASRKYLHIRAWGEYMGSMNYYIVDQQALAEKDGAPENALYKRGEEWITADTIENIFAKDYVNKRVQELKQIWQK